MFSLLIVEARSREGGKLTMSYLIALIVILFLVLCVVLVIANPKD